MKKRCIAIAMIAAYGIAAHPFQAFSRNRTEASPTEKPLFTSKELASVKKLRGEGPWYKTDTAKATALGGIGVGGLAAAAANPYNQAEERLLGSMFGATLVGGGTYLKDRARRYWVMRKINPILEKHTLYNFQTLAAPEAALVYAAYQKNLPRMKTLAPRLKRFIARDGVLNALYEIYTKRPPTVDGVTRMQFELFGPENY